MGRNDNGQLGIGNTIDQNTSVHIATDVIAVAAGDSHTIFAKNDGSLWVMGAGGQGRLGDGNSFQLTSATEINGYSDVVAVGAGSLHSLFVTSNGKLYGMGANDKGQLGIGNDTNQTLPVEIRSGGVLDATAGLSTASLNQWKFIQHGH